MSANYASGLSEYKNKGTCGTKEVCNNLYSSLMLFIFKKFTI